MDNGMAMDEQAAGLGRSSGESDVAQGLQWGPGAGSAPASPAKKKSSSGKKAAKEEQVCLSMCTYTTDCFLVTLHACRQKMIVSAAENALSRQAAELQHSL